MSYNEEALLQENAELKERILRLKIENEQLIDNEFVIDVTGILPTKGHVYELMQKHVLEHTPVECVYLKDSEYVIDMSGNLPTKGHIWEMMKKHVLANTYVDGLFETNENFPIEGSFWDLMREHVLDNTDDNEKLEYIDGDSVKNTWKLGELYDNDEIVEHIRNNDILPDEIYTPTQLSQLCETLNKGLLADNEIIRAKYNRLITKTNRIQSAKDKILADADIFWADRERICADRERIHCSNSICRCDDKSSNAGANDKKVRFFECDSRIQSGVSDIDSEYTEKPVQCPQSKN